MFVDGLLPCQKLFNRQLVAIACLVERQQPEVVRFV